MIPTKKLNHTKPPLADPSPDEVAIAMDPKTHHSNPNLQPPTERERRNQRERCRARRPSCALGGIELIGWAIRAR
jgi:hypothetical protein